MDKGLKGELREDTAIYVDGVGGGGAALILGPPRGPGESPVLTRAAGRLPERGRGWKRLSPGRWERPGPRSPGPPCQDPKPRTVRTLASLEPPGPRPCSTWGEGLTDTPVRGLGRGPAGAGGGDWGCPKTATGEETREESERRAPTE